MKGIQIMSSVPTALRAEFERMGRETTAHGRLTVDSIRERGTPISLTLRYGGKSFQITMYEKEVPSFWEEVYGSLPTPIADEMSRPGHRELTSEEILDAHQIASQKAELAAHLNNVGYSGPVEGRVAVNAFAAAIGETVVDCRGNPIPMSRGEFLAAGEGEIYALVRHTCMYGRG